jgi:actin
MSDNSAVVMDNGSGESKIGMATKNDPRLIDFPTIVGQHRSDFFINGSDSKLYIGHDAINKKGSLTFIRPVKRGLIEDWEHMIRIWQYCFNYELKVDPQEHPVLLTEHPTNTRKIREETMEIFFEKFKVPVFFMANQSVLSLYALGSTTGLVLDCGEDSTTAVAVFEGYSIKNSVVQSDIGGGMLSNHIRHVLQSKGIKLKGKAEREVIQDIKEKKCRLFEILKEQRHLIDDDSKVLTEANSYVLPDGIKIDISSLNSSTPNLIFNSNKSLSKSDINAPDLVNLCLNKLDDDLANHLSSQIAVTGGSSMFSGFKRRLIHDLKTSSTNYNYNLIQTMSTSKKIRLKSAKKPTLEAKNKISLDSIENAETDFLLEQEPMLIPAKYLTWIGGSLLASKKAFQTEWIKQADWKEEGISIIHRSCL